MEKNRQSTEKQMDLSPVLDECLGHLDMVEDLFAMYKDNITEFQESMDRHLENSDSDGIIFATHKIKCSLKMLRTESLVLLTEQMHQSVKNGSGIDGIDKLYHRFKMEYPEVEIKLEESLKRLKHEINICKE